MAIGGDDIYRVASAMVPLYLAMALGFCAVRFWGVFSEEQCAAVGRYVSLFAVPFLNFQIIATTDLYHINGHLLAADSATKIVVLVALCLWALFLRPRNRSLSWASDWALTSFMVSALPNTLIIGIPVLGSMYGRHAEELMAQLVVVQIAVWFIAISIFLEFRAAREESFRAMTMERNTLQLVLDEGKNPSSELGQQNGGRENFSDCAGKGTEANLVVMEEAEPEKSIDSINKATTSENSVTFNIDINYNNNHESGIINDRNDSIHTSHVNGEESEAVKDEVRRQEVSEMVPRKDMSKAEERKMGRMILLLLGRKLLRNVMLWSGFAGVAYSLLSFGADFGYPKILKYSVDIVAKTGLGMAMFNLGLFSANQRSWVPCGLWTATWTGLLRFALTPAIIGGISAAFGLKGDLLRIAIVQAALPQGIIPFVFASEYKVLPEVASTGVTLGTLLSLPILFVFYVALSN